MANPEPIGYNQRVFAIVNQLIGYYSMIAILLPTYYHNYNYQAIILLLTDQVDYC